MSRMSRSSALRLLAPALFATSLLIGCGQPAGNVATVNSNTGRNANINANTFNANVGTTASGPTFVEPQTYQGVISLTIQTVGEKQDASMPPLKAVVARNAADRAMEFTLPTNEKVVYFAKRAFDRCRAVDTFVSNSGKISCNQGSDWLSELDCPQIDRTGLPRHIEENGRSRLQQHRNVLTPWLC